MYAQQQQQQQFAQQQAAANAAAATQLAAILAAAHETVAQYDPNVHLKTQDFDQHTERTLYVKLEGSLSDFERGTIKPTWYADEGCEHIYQRIAGRTPEGQVLFEGDTSKGLILGLELETLSSTFPVDIGAVIHEVNGKEFTASGRQYAFIARSHCDWEPKKCIFEPASKVTRAMLEKYNDTSASMMETHCFRSGNGLTLVDNLSPLTAMLRLNAETLKMTFGIPEGQEGFLKVATPIVDACLRRYEEDQKVSFIDMKKFKIDFERVDSPNQWDRAEGVIDNLRSQAKGSNGHAASQRLTNKYALVAKVNAKLVLYGDAKKE